MYRTRKVLIPILLTSLLFVILLLPLSGCLSLVAQSEAPRLLTTIDMPLRTGHGPGTIAVNAVGYAYVAVNGIEQSSIKVLNGPATVDTILWPQDQGGTFVDILIHPATNWLYIKNRSLQQVNIVSGTEFIIQIPDLIFPTDIELDPKSGLVYVSNWVHERKKQEDVYNIVSDIAVISGTTVITRILTQNPQVIKHNPVTGHMLVGLDTSGYTDPEPMLWVLDGTEVVTKTNLASDLWGRVLDMAVNPNSGEVYLLDKGELVYWDGHDEVKRAYVGAASHVAVDPKRGWAYVTRIKKPNLLIFDKDQKIAELFTSYDSRELVVDSKRDYVYVTNREGLLSVIRGTEVITTMVTGGIGASYIGLDEERGYVYVSNGDSHSIAVFGFEEAAVAPSSLWQQFFPLIQK